MSVTICERYSGQQKLAVSTVTPVPPPPPEVRPNPWPRAPVFTRVEPSCGSPVAGVRAVDSFGASRGCGFTTRAFFVGSAISGVFGAGGVSTTFFTGSGGGACTVRPPIVVNPPLRGPGAPPTPSGSTLRRPQGLAHPPSP